MSHTLPSRRIVALIAAYVVALQALLLPLSVVAGAPDASLCASAASASAQYPGGGHATGCPCAAGCGTQCCVTAIAGPPQTIAILAPVSIAKLAPAPVAASDARPDRHSPQLARAPPAA
jgi:hypothetical protein